MSDRWRGRRAGLAVVAALAVAAMAATVLGAPAGGSIVVTDPAGRVMARVSLEGETSFALRYRNSLYGTLAEERFAVAGETFRLTELAAEQLAVLEEYYAVNQAPRRTSQGWWTSAPAYELELRQLRLAATDLGERVLAVPGQTPVELWRLVDDAAPSVLISLDETP